MGNLLHYRQGELVETLSNLFYRLTIQNCMKRRLTIWGVVYEYC